MNCLDGQIGVVGLAGHSSAKSGLYINDLPGLTLKQLDKIKDSTEDAISVSSAWERIYKRAKKNLEFDVIAANRKHFKQTSIISSRMTGQVGTTRLTAQGVLSGHYFDMEDYSPLLEIFFNSALIYVYGYDTVTIDIYDATTGNLLISKSETADADGLLRIEIQEGFSVFEYPRLFVCYDDTLLEVYKTADYAYSDYRFNDKRQVATGSNVVYSNLSAGDTGLILNYNVKCGVLSWICQNIDVFIKPFWYKLGVEWLNERAHSDRLNRYTMIGIEEATALKEEFESEYKTSLDDILATMHPTDDGFCFTCNKAMNKKYMLP